MRNLLGSASRVTGELVTPLGAGDIPQTVAGFHGAYSGVKSGWMKAAYMWKNGYSIDNIVRLPDLPVQVKILGNEKWPNVIARAMETGDQFFRAMGGEIAGHTGAFRRARAAGPLRSPAFRQRYGEILANRPDDLIKEMAEAGAEAVFRPQPGGVQRSIKDFRTALDAGMEGLGEAVYKITGQRWMGVLASAPVGTFLLPFLQTPIGIYRAGAAFSPVGSVRGRYKMRQLRRAGTPTDPHLATEATAGMARARRMRSQGNVGTAMLVPLAWMAAEGRLTGSGPKGDPKARALWLKSHQPNSILIGGTWYNYSMFQPISIPASVVANAFEVWHEKAQQGKVEWADAGALSASILARTANSQLQASYLTSVMAIQQAIEDPDRYAPRTIARQGAAFVPLSSFFRNLARTGDPTARAPEGLMEMVQTGMPEMVEQGLRAIPGSPWPSEDKVPARLDLFGEPIVYGLPDESTVSRLLSPVYRQRKSDDALVQELERTGARLTPATDTLGQIPLTRAQKFFVEQTTAREQARAVRVLIATEQYQALPTTQEKVEMIHTEAEIARGLQREGLRRQMLPVLMESLNTLPAGAFRDEVKQYLESMRASIPGSE
jgi:hypothetical protein